MHTSEPVKGRPVLIGAFPPPVHGMAVVNAAIRDALIARSSAPIWLDIAGRSLKRGVLSQIRRLPRVIRSLCRFALIRGGKGAVYMSVSGGAGQIYEVLFLAVCRLKGATPYLHHHSYAYLDKPKWLTKLLMLLAGRRACHIVLSRGMERSLRANYAPGRVMVLSNAAIFPKEAAPHPVRREAVKRLGFMSNISREKGVFAFLELMERIQATGMPISGLLAGPFQDEETERAVRERMDVLTSTEYVGPVYGPSKEAFLQKIDVLVFPTQYQNEAEPLTIHEAMSRGIPVIAYARGAIEEIVSEGAGLSVPASDEFVGPAIGQLSAWLASSNSFQSASDAAAASFAQLSAQAETARERLLMELHPD